MLNHLTNLFLICLSFTLLGCGESTRKTKEPPIWEKIKIQDLAPKYSGQRTNGFPQTANFDVFIIEIPISNINKIKDTSAKMYTHPLRYKKKSVFEKNLFAAAMCTLDMWDEISESLRKTGGQTSQKDAIIIPKNKYGDFTTTIMENEQTVFYTSIDNSTEAITTGPGKLAMRLETEEFPGHRGMCILTIVPASVPIIKRQIPEQLEKMEETGEMIFESASVTLKISPGEMVFVWPTEEYFRNRATLNGLFFDSDDNKAAVKTYLIVCTAINY